MPPGRAQQSSYLAALLSCTPNTLQYLQTALTLGGFAFQERQQKGAIPCGQADNCVSVRGGGVLILESNSIFYFYFFGTKLQWKVCKGQSLPDAQVMG